MSDPGQHELVEQDIRIAELEEQLAALQADRERLEAERNELGYQLGKLVGQLASVASALRSAGIEPPDEPGKMGVVIGEALAAARDVAEAFKPEPMGPILVVGGNECERRLLRLQACWTKPRKEGP